MGWNSQIGVFFYYRIFIIKEIIMKKVIRLTESDLVKIVKRVILEQVDNSSFYSFLKGKKYKMYVNPDYPSGYWENHALWY